MRVGIASCMHRQASCDAVFAEIAHPGGDSANYQDVTGPLTMPESTAFRTSSMVARPPRA